MYTRGLCRGWILDNWLQFQKSVMESKMSTNGGTKKAHLKVQPENTINVLCRNITFGLLFVGTMVFFLFQSWQEQTTSKSYIYSFFSTHSCFLLSFARVSIDLAVQCTFSQYFFAGKTKYLLSNLSRSQHKKSQIVIIEGNWRKGQKYYSGRDILIKPFLSLLLLYNFFDPIFSLKIFYFLYSIELLCYRARFFSPAPWCSIIGVVVFQRYSIFGIL